MFRWGKNIDKSSALADAAAAPYVGTFFFGPFYMIDYGSLFVFFVFFILLSVYLFYFHVCIILADDVELNPGLFNGKKFKFCYCNIQGLKANSD